MSLLKKKKEEEAKTNPLVNGTMEFKEAVETTYVTKTEVISYCCQDMYDALHDMHHSDYGSHLSRSGKKISLNYADKPLKFCPFCGARL
jgi:hypothetical protein